MILIYVNLAIYFTSAVKKLSFNLAVPFTFSCVAWNKSVFEILNIRNMAVLFHKSLHENKEEAEKRIKRKRKPIKLPTKHISPMFFNTLSKKIFTKQYAPVATKFVI